MVGRRALLPAMVLALATSSGAPVPDLFPPLSTNVTGVDALPHRVMLVMGAGGQNWPDRDRGGPWDPEQVGPSFVLYEDGLVIYRRLFPGASQMMEARLSRDEASALVEELVGYGFLRLPGKHWLTGATHQPGAAIALRRGTTWHSASVDGIDRYGSPSLDSAEDPCPAFVSSLRRLTLFEAKGAVPWRPREFAVHLTDGALYPGYYGKTRVTWPESVPKPQPGPRPEYADRAYGIEHLQALKDLPIVDWGTFVMVDGHPWIMHITPAVVPEHEYLERVETAISLAWWELQQQAR